MNHSQYMAMVNNRYCFTARWISPETGKQVTAAHFSSFIDCISQIYNRPKHVHTNTRF